MGNTMTGTAQAETLDATVRALWDTVNQVTGMNQDWRDEMHWQIGRLAGALTVVDGSRAHGVAGVPLDEGLVSVWVFDARSCIDRVKRDPHGVPWLD